MRFSDLDNGENKQRLNLSERAVSVLLNDMRVFQLNGAEAVDSKMINHIFKNYSEDAKASIYQACERKRKELEATLSGVRRDVAHMPTLDRIIASYKKQLISEVMPCLNDNSYSLPIRVSADNLDYLASDEAQQEAEFYDDRVGKYIKAVIEEYCSLTYLERERVYFRDSLSNLERALLHERILKITLNSKRVIDGVEKNNTLYMKPIGVMHDTQFLYNYFVGLTSTDKTNWEPGSVRVTSIKACRPLSEQSTITKTQRIHLGELIKRRGVQYLSSNADAEKIIVRLTPGGKRMYDRMLHLRPQWASKDGDEYTFDCTVRQADNYFFRFGEDAKIIAPKSLAESFERRYKAAAEQYKK